LFVKNLSSVVRKNDLSLSSMDVTAVCHAGYYTTIFVDIKNSTKEIARYPTSTLPAPPARGGRVVIVALWLGYTDARFCEINGAFFQLNG
jgi:hypothetical protein